MVSTLFRGVGQLVDKGGFFRHVVELSDWRLDPPVPAGTFASDKAAQAKRIKFAPPGAS
jgi:hypothetical protein